MNDAAARAHVRPQVGIHSVDIDQPPGIGTAPIADIDALCAIVAATLATNSNAQTPTNTRSDEPAARRVARRCPLAQAARTSGS
jgi:hypothetical protein